MSSPLYRWTIRWARTIHLYTTLFALALFLFFSITGFMLNHEDWFTDPDPREIRQTGTIPSAMLQGPDKLAVVELLRAEYHAVGAMEVFEVEPDRLRVEFKGPGRRTEALIDPSTGEAEVVYQTRGFWGVMLDLHRGKNTGKGWSILIDATCVVLLLISMTGMVMFASLRGRGKYGVFIVFVGLLVSVAVFFVFVP